MAKPFRFRYVNQIAGSFVAVVVIILIASLVLAAHAQKWFQHVVTIHFIMPEDGFHGIKAGAEIRMLGTTAGTVDSTYIDAKSQKPIAVGHIALTFAVYVRVGPNGSKAIIHEPAVLADPLINITRADEGLPIKDQGELTAIPESGASDTLNQILEDVQKKTLPQVSQLLDQYTQLAADLRNPQGPILPILARVDKVAGQLEKTDNLVGQLLNDKQMAANVAQIVTKLTQSTDDIQALIVNLRQTTDALPGIANAASDQVKQLPPMIDQTRQMMQEVQKSLHDLQQTTQQLPGIMVSLKQTVDQLPDAMVQTEQTLIEIQKLVKGLQGLPFVRDNVDQTPTAGKSLKPSDVGGPQ